MRTRNPIQFVLGGAMLLVLCVACVGSVATSADEAAVQLHGAAPHRIVLAMEEPLRECLAQRLGAGLQTVVRLHMRDVESRDAAGLKAVHLYLQVPQQDAAKSESSAEGTRSDEDRLGALVLGFAQGESHVWNLGPLLASQWQLGRRDWLDEGELRLDLVAEAWEHTPLAADFRLSVRELVLEAPECAVPSSSPPEPD